VTSGTLTTTFEYDGLGNRVAQTVDGVTTEYVLDVAGGLPEVIVATVGGGSTWYVQVQGQILAQYEAGAWGYILPDALGSVRQLVGSDSQVNLAQSFDPFGVPFETSGSGESDFGYTGEWWNSEAALLYLRARYYEPAIGRFVSKDPWQGDSSRPQTFNSYGYVGGNPINLADPSGRCYPPIAFLRQVPGEAMLCRNLDLAIIIYAHPYSSLSEVTAASTYISAWSVGHAALLVGTAGLLIGGLESVAVWGYGYLVAHPTLAEGVAIGTTIAGTADDAATLYAAATGDPEAVGEIIAASAVDGPLPFADTIEGARFFGSRGLQACQSAGDALDAFVKARLGKTAPDVNCYGCALNEWFIARGEPPLMENLRPNPWGDTLEETINFVERRDDLIESAIRSNFREVPAEDLRRGDLISWHRTRRLNFGLGHGSQEYYYTSHVGIYLGDGQVFSKVGREGAYEILPLASPILAQYAESGAVRYWTPE
jgi:RHS repeat-associated protein